jgi:hypothetical protein
MAKTFLVTGTPAKLTVDIAHECLAAKNKVLLTLEPGTEAPAIPPGLEENLQYVEWNRRSPISARFVLLQAFNQQIAIDHAIVVYNPRLDRSVFHEENAAVIEERVDFDVKGFLFMVKELLMHFQKQNSGTITFVVQNTGPDVLSPFDSLGMHGFQGMVESLFTYYSQETFSIRGVQTRLAQNRQIAEFLLNLISEDSVKTRNKWSRYTGKSGLFNFGK